MLLSMPHICEKTPHGPVISRVQKELLLSYIIEKSWKLSLDSIPFGLNLLQNSYNLLRQRDKS